MAQAAISKLKELRQEHREPYYERFRQYRENNLIPQYNQMMLQHTRFMCRFTPLTEPDILEAEDYCGKKRCEDWLDRESRALFAQYLISMKEELKVITEIYIRQFCSDWEEVT
jgi:hypothetical protein